MVVAKDVRVRLALVVLLPVLGREPAVAELALERLLARVDALVAHEGGLVAGVVAADGAEVPLGEGEGVDPAPRYLGYAGYRVLERAKGKNERKPQKIVGKINTTLTRNANQTTHKRGKKHKTDYKRGLEVKEYSISCR